MRRFLPICALFVLAAAAGLYVISSSLHSTTAFPEYSSGRTDPAGASILFESLRSLNPATIRNYRPLITIRPAPGRTLLLIGLPLDNLLKPDILKALSTFLTTRTVIAFSQIPNNPRVEIAKQLKAIWDIEIKAHTVVAGPSWTTLVRGQAYQRGNTILCTSSAPFLNAALLRSKDTAFLDRIFGQNPTVIFDETHLGLQESGSVMGIIQEQRLTPLLFCLLFLTALWIWRAASPFPPPPSVETLAPQVGLSSQSALLELLRAHIPPSQVPALCWREATKTERPTAAIAASAEQALRTTADPVAAMRTIYKQLKKHRAEARS